MNNTENKEKNLTFLKGFRLTLWHVPIWCKWRILLLYFIPTGKK